MNRNQTPQHSRIKQVLLPGLLGLLLLLLPLSCSQPEGPEQQSTNDPDPSSGVSEQSYMQDFGEMVRKSRITGDEEEKEQESNRKAYKARGAKKEWKKIKKKQQQLSRKGATRSKQKKKASSGGTGGGFLGGSFSKGSSGKKETNQKADVGTDTELLFIPRHRKTVTEEENTSTGRLVAVMDRKDKTVRRGCPLEKTDVDATIEGMVGTVSVTQTYKNPYDTRLEAEYKFPLPHSSAVHGFRMEIGDRTIRGVIRKKEKAREMYRKAKAKGHRASLLTQERPNIFQEKVANIEPGEKIDIHVDFFQYITYESGEYQWVFPLVVGPRFLGGEAGSNRARKGRVRRGAPGGDNGDGGPETVEGDAHVNPEVSPPKTIPGHMVNLSVNVDAGVPIQEVNSPSHLIDLDQSENKHRFTASIKSSDKMPNKDFIIRWSVDPESVQYALHTSKSERGRYFSFLIQPPVEAGEEAKPGPIHWNVIVDRSGSMEGQKMRAGKLAAKRLVEKFRDVDTVSLISFANETKIHFRSPLNITDNGRATYKKEVSEIKADGGTRLPDALEQSRQIDSKDERRDVYVVISDALHAKEGRVLKQVEDNRNSRYFFVAVGQAPNRYLSNRLAQIGNGAAWSMRSDEDPGRILGKFKQYLESPVIENIKLKWKGMDVVSTYPSEKQIPDLFADRPLFVSGAIKKVKADTPKLIITGKKRDEKVRYTVPVKLDQAREKKAVETLWARLRMKELMNKYAIAGTEKARNTLRDAVVDLSTDFKLMSQFTAFVAVDESETTEGGPLRTEQVPVHMPEGMHYEEITGEQGKEQMDVDSNPLGVNLNINDDGRMNVTGVAVDSAAARNGLESGAVVTSVNGKAGATGTDLRQAINAWSPGETLSITFQQKGQTIKITWTHTGENEKDK